MTEKPADGEDRFAMGKGHRGMGMANIMATNIFDFRLDPDRFPEPFKGSLR